MGVCFRRVVDNYILSAAIDIARPVRDKSSAKAIIAGGLLSKNYYEGKRLKTRHSKTYSRKGTGVELRCGGELIADNPNRETNFSVTGCPKCGMDVITEGCSPDTDCVVEASPLLDARWTEGRIQTLPLYELPTILLKEGMVNGGKLNEKGKAVLNELLRRADDVESFGKIQVRRIR